MNLTIQHIGILGFSCLVLGAVPALSEERMICEFTEFCTRDDGCEPTTEAATTIVKIGDGFADVSLKGDFQRFRQAANAEADPVSYFATDLEEGGGVMLSIFHDGQAVMSMHGQLFGPFVATAHGNCQREDG